MDNINTGWDFSSNEGGGGGNKVEFTKFPEGLTKIRIITPVPFQRWTHWIQSAKRSINCPGKGCPICEIRTRQKQSKEPATYPMAKKFSVKVYNHDLNRVEILEQGITFFEDLKIVREDLIDDGKKLSDAKIKVRRKGTTKDNTTYRIDIDEVCSLTNEEQARVDEDTTVLVEYFKPHTIEQITRIVNGEKWEDVMTSKEEEFVPLVGEDEEIELA